MTARRAMYRESDLRKLAKVCREENVMFDVKPNGGFKMSPLVNGGIVPCGDDLDDRLARFAAS